MDAYAAMIDSIILLEEGKYSLPIGHTIWIQRVLHFRNKFNYVLKENQSSCSVFVQITYHIAILFYTEEHSSIV
jgi:hypothetical protein